MNSNPNHYSTRWGAENSHASSPNASLRTKLPFFSPYIQLIAYQLVAKMSEAGIKNFTVTVLLLFLYGFVDPPLSLTWAPRSWSCWGGGRERGWVPWSCPWPGRAGRWPGRTRGYPANFINLLLYIISVGVTLPILWTCHIINEQLCINWNKTAHIIIHL